jgi:hypothetical protein
MIAHGWAVEERGEISVRTVQDTRIGAMVNWLVVSAGISVMRGDSDETIKNAFDHYAALAEAKLVKVTIQEADHDAN